MTLQIYEVPGGSVALNLEKNVDTGITEGQEDTTRLRAYTWINKPTPGPIGSKIYITDVGEYGAEYISNGNVWTHSGEIEIIQKGKGWIVPSLAAANAATYSQTGTIITVTSTGHNIPDLAYNSKDVYLNIATGSAIAGWFSNFQYVSANSFTCVSTISQTTSGTINTNLDYVTIADLNAIILNNTVGLNGVTKYSFLLSNNNSAGNKNIKVNYGDLASLVTTNTTSTYMSVVDRTIANRNSNTSKVIDINGLITVFDVDSTINQNFYFSLQCQSANDYVAIHSASLYVNPS